MKAESIGRAKKKGLVFKNIFRGGSRISRRWGGVNPFGGGVGTSDVGAFQ